MHTAEKPGEGSVLTRQVSLCVWCLCVGEGERGREGPVLTRQVCVGGRGEGGGGEMAKDQCWHARCVGRERGGGRRRRGGEGSVLTCQLLNRKVLR